MLAEKQAHRLTLSRAGKTLRTYRIALGPEPSCDKVCRGDHKTPEGLLTIDRHVPNSAFHRALHVSYPDAAHRRAARRHGCDPGGDIMIHGIKNGMGWLGPLHRRTDWTDGCMAVTDEEIEEIYAAVPNGTPVEIRPSFLDLMEHASAGALKSGRPAGPASLLEAQVVSTLIRCPSRDGACRQV